MFDFLKNFAVEENAPVEKAVKTGGGKAPQERNPTNGAHLRLFKDGRIYPSVALATKYNLEYTDILTKGGNGFDITDSRKWSNTEKNPNGVIFLSVAPKSAGKVSLFMSTTYYKKDDEMPEGKKVGDAKSSVLTQGKSTFATEQLIPMLREVYDLPLNTGIDAEGKDTFEDKLFGDTNFVDLFIAEDHGVTLPDGIYHLPKVMTKGENKGLIDPVRRENIVMMPLVVFKPEYVATVEEESVSAEFTTQEEPTYENVQ